MICEYLVFQTVLCKGFYLPSPVCDSVVPAAVFKLKRGRETERGEMIKRIEREGDLGVGGWGCRDRVVDGRKMREVNSQKLSERGRQRETGGAQFAITCAAGQKVSKKEDESVDVCVWVCE